MRVRSRVLFNGVPTFVGVCTAANVARTATPVTVHATRAPALLVALGAAGDVSGRVTVAVAGGMFDAGLPNAGWCVGSGMAVGAVGATRGNSPPHAAANNIALPRHSARSLDNIRSCTSYRRQPRRTLEQLSSPTVPNIRW